MTSLPREFTRTASPKQGPQGATPRTRSAGTTPTWTADLDSVVSHTAEDFSSCTTEPASRRGGPPRVTRTGLSEVGPQASTLPSTSGILYPAARTRCTQRPAQCWGLCIQQVQAAAPWCRGRTLGGARVAQSILGQRVDTHTLGFGCAFVFDVVLLYSTYRTLYSR